MRHKEEKSPIGTDLQDGLRQEGGSVCPAFQHPSRRDIPVVDQESVVCGGEVEGEEKPPAHEEQKIDAFPPSIAIDFSRVSWSVSARSNEEGRHVRAVEDG